MKVLQPGATRGTFRIWLVIILVFIVMMALGVGTAFAGFCWAG
jgi:hypothetical protein